MKLWTKVIYPPLGSPFLLSGHTMLLGSCFADTIGGKMAAAGFNVLVNPFGTLYNPASLLSAVERLDSDTMFGLSDCVEMGAQAGRICSFEHHTSFARETAEEFLENANARLLEARAFWKCCDRVILTLGTSFVWYAGGKPVSNCLKRPAGEFTRRMLSVEESAACLDKIIKAHPDKRFMLTVSPIRHLGDGAHANSVSKARLLLAADGCSGADYFPAFEILNDELRDYRFYADDLVHPSNQAVEYIWEAFLDGCTDPGEREMIEQNEKAARLKAHRKILSGDLTTLQA
ncbi:MAG: GSCFA domain-containing protein [Bacteroidales bacterium]|nr:GSCFA domain-containing protein [Bacteroidales bacterium]